MHTDTCGSHPKFLLSSQQHILPGRMISGFVMVNSRAFESSNQTPLFSTFISEWRSSERWNPVSKAWTLYSLGSMQAEKKFCLGFYPVRHSCPVCSPPSLHIPCSSVSYFAALQKTDQVTMQRIDHERVQSVSNVLYLALRLKGLLWEKTESPNFGIFMVSWKGSRIYHRSISQTGHQWANHLTSPSHL